MYVYTNINPYNIYIYIYRYRYRYFCDNFHRFLASGGLCSCGAHRGLHFPCGAEPCFEPTGRAARPRQGDHGAAAQCGAEDASLGSRWKNMKNDGQMLVEFANWRCPRLSGSQ